MKEKHIIELDKKYDSEKIQLVTHGGAKWKVFGVDTLKESAFNV